MTQGEPGNHGRPGKVGEQVNSLFSCLFDDLPCSPEFKQRMEAMGFCLPQPGCGPGALDVLWETCSEAEALSEQH